MSEIEKVTVNLSVVDLGKIDLLVEQGFHSSRTDFIRDAIRRSLQELEPTLQSTITRQSYTLGVQRLSRRELEAIVAKGVQLDLRVVGMLLLADDVSPELARQALASVEVKGVLRAPAGVRTALSDRIS